MPAQADSIDVKSYYFDGLEQNAQVLLNTEKTKIEYRTVTVPATCYRTEYRRVCHPRPRSCRQECRNGRCTTVCSPAGRICRNEIVQIPYRCMRRVTRPFEVHDYYVDTYAQLNFDLQNLDGGVGENFKISMKGEQDKLTLQDSKNYLVLLRNKSRSESFDGAYKTVNLKYDISFASVKKIDEVIGNGIKNVSLENGILQFELGKTFNTREFIQNLKVYKSRTLSKDILLFDRNLMQNEMDIQIMASNSVITVDLVKLGIQIPSKTRVILTTKFNERGAEILNSSKLKIQATANWIFSK